MPLALPLLLGLLRPPHPAAQPAVQRLSTIRMEAPVRSLDLGSGPQCPPALTSCPGGSGSSCWTESLGDSIPYLCPSSWGWVPQPQT